MIPLLFVTLMQCPDGTPPPCAGRTAAAPARAIAVLPFENRSTDTADAYLAEALTERVTTRLAQVRSLQVKARTLVDGQWALTPNALVAARRLNVAYFVTGRVRRQAGRVSINAQLVQLSSGTEAWAGIVETGGDLTQLEAVVAESVATGVINRLSPGDRALLARRPTRDSVAYDLYLRAIYHARKYTDGDIRHALELLDQATRRDPDFAAAWAEIGNTWLKLAEDFAEPAAAFEAARAAADRARRIDPQNVKATMIAGISAAMQARDQRAAARAIDRALEREPDMQEGLTWRGIFRLAEGRASDALAGVSVAWQQDSISLFSVFGELYVLAYAATPESLLALSRRAKQWQPVAAAWEGLALYRLGRCAELRDPVPLDPVISGSLAAPACAGRMRQVADSLARAARSGQYIAPFHLAEAYGLAGEVDSAVAWLGRADERLSLYVYMSKLSPFFASMRSDPRFVALTRRLRLP